MDGRRQVTVKEHPDPVSGKPSTATAVEGFYVIAGHNPGTHGAVLSDALSSRFGVQIAVPTDYRLAAEMGVHEKAVKVAEHLNSRVGTKDIGWAPQTRELLAFQETCDLLGEDAAGCRTQRSHTRNGRPHGLPYRQPAAGLRGCFPGFAGSALLSKTRRQCNLRTGEIMRPKRVQGPSDLW